MILSVSRRTDIPNYYFDWFVERLRQGEVLVRNPFQPHQVSRIPLSPDVIDCMVFWTKNPSSMMRQLEELNPYPYYVQFTITGYGREMEPNLPSKREVILPTFQALSRKIGKERVIWRYDPIFVNERYSLAYHKKAFREIAQTLSGYTDRVVISFVDLYEKTKRNTKGQGIRLIREEEVHELCRAFSEVAKQNGLTIESCAEQMDLEKYGIAHGHCVDKTLIETLLGASMKGRKDKNQRKECGCIESIDIGCYNSCGNGCTYCYANYNGAMVEAKRTAYDIHSPLLCSELTKEDKVYDRIVESIVEPQLRFF